MQNRKINSKSVWIWYPGDFELYHGMLQNFSREERGFDWPAFWKMDDWRKSVRLYRSYDLKEETSFVVTATGSGYVQVNRRKHLFGETIVCGPGKALVEIFVGSMTGLPAVFVEGDVIYSDQSWMADDFTEGGTGTVGVSSLYETKDLNPNAIAYQEELCDPAIVTETADGLLMDFGRMINGTLQLKFENNGSTSVKGVTVCYGESEKEARDVKMCYYKQEQVTEESSLRRRAFRFLFFPGCRKTEISCQAVHQFVPIPVKASFSCGDDTLNQIWETAKETYRMCSGLFFIDGVKRDRWIWSGDAYQSYFVNPYLFFDEEIDKRTMLALRGNLGINQHLNTIVDYSLLWIIAVENEYQMDGNAAFVESIYPKMEDLMQFFSRQLDEHGFIYGRKKDWIFIDWSDIDKDGCVCAEQMLLLKCYQTMQVCGTLLGKDVSAYETAFTELKEQIQNYYWNEEKGAFIDSFQSGKNHVTRHANLFAILFDLVSEEQKKLILQNVILNPEITQITTPYFKFFELDVLCKAGYLKEVLETMKGYWGGMLKKGAVTFWEDFSPKQGEEEQYSMYGDPYGKSLCHAWGASPIYLLGHYFLGVRPLEPGYGRFAVEPKLEFFEKLDCVVPVRGGSVCIRYDGKTLTVKTDRSGGVLIVDGTERALQAESLDVRLSTGITLKEG